MIDRKVIILLFIISIAAVTWLMLMPSPPQIEGNFKFIDKIEHAVVFFVLSLLLFKSIEPKKTGKRRAALMAAAGLGIYGAAIEVLQNLTGRSMELMDVFADLSGIALGFFLYFFL